MESRRAPHACRRQLWPLAPWLMAGATLLACKPVGIGSRPNPAADAFATKVINNPMVFAGDPYAADRATSRQQGSHTVCALRYEQDRIHYRIRTFTDADAAATAGHILTHAGACGTCSTLQDLAVYLRHPDLTTPVRRCAARVLFRDWTVGCLRQLGFSAPCADTWYYNARHTAQECFWVCLWAWISRAPFNDADGGLNRCLACDEKRSGPVFKRVAGRTRRNSGLVSAVVRQPEEVVEINHDDY